mmetsp:Transcript_22485/g.68536  ORF Transcript_22485/g.68536 Transcript_22485/m.68536 type:complete len:253 (+) Transcript_22485:675-1433(+)
MPRRAMKSQTVTSSVARHADADVASAVCGVSFACHRSWYQKTTASFAARAAGSRSMLLDYQMACAPYRSCNRFATCVVIVVSKVTGSGTARSCLTATATRRRPVQRCLRKSMARIMSVIALWYMRRRCETKRRLRKGAQVHLMELLRSSLALQPMTPSRLTMKEMSMTSGTHSMRMLKTRGRRQRGSGANMCGAARPPSSLSATGRASGASMTTLARGSVALFATSIQTASWRVVGSRGYHLLPPRAVMLRA